MDLDSNQKPVTGAEWRALALVVLSVCLNYIDRTSFAAAALAISSEFRISPDRLGLILSAFFWLYPPFQIVSGWLVDRFDVRWVLGLGFVLWSVVTGLTGFAGGVTALLVIRAALARRRISCLSVLRQDHRDDFSGEPPRDLQLAHRGRKPGRPGGGHSARRLDRRDLRLARPVLLHQPHRSALAACLDQVGAPAHPDASGGSSARGAVVRRHPPAAFGVGNVLRTVRDQLRVDLPRYLAAVLPRHRTPLLDEDDGCSASVPFWGLAGATFSCGWLSDRWITRGGTPTLVRKTFTVGGLLLCTFLFLPAALVGDPMLAIALLTAACLAFGMTSSNVWTITQTIAGPGIAGKWTGMQNAVGNLAGVVAPWLTGWIVARTGAFYLAFVLVCGFSLAGAASFLFLVGRVEPTSWRCAETVVEESPV